MKMLKTSSLVLIAIAAAGLLVQCGAPADLLGKIEARVASTEPNMLLYYNNEEIPDGGVSSAFIDAVQGTPYDVEFTIENRGNADLLLRESEAIEFSGYDAALFSLLTSPGDLVVSPGAETSFTVRFELDGQGEKNAQMAIYSNDPDKNPYICGLSNTALPEIRIDAGGIEIPSGSGSYDFGERGYGQPIDVDFTITNAGNADLELTGGTPVSVSGEGFSVQSQPASLIAAGASSIFTVRFDAAQLGDSLGTVSIDNSDGDENPYVFDLSATCFVPMVSRHLATGLQHTLAVKDDGTVWACGLNNEGQLGDGTTDSSIDFQQVTGLTDVEAVSANTVHSMALKNDGTVWTWGENFLGMLGDGTTDPSYIPQQVSGLTDVVDVAAGEVHSVALTSNGEVWIWGHANKIGDGNGSIDELSPVRVAALSNIVQIAAGTECTFALDDTGTLWSWGNNIHGQLGDGSTNQQFAPVEVSLSSSTTAVAAGYYHAAALCSDGNLYGWGDNNSGQVGTGSSSDFEAVPVEVTVFSGSEVQEISIGRQFSAVVKTDGTVWSWGANDHGQIGDGTTEDSLTAVQATGVTDIVELSTRDQVIALKSDGTLYSYGFNNYKQLGRSTETSFDANPIPTLIPCTSDFQFIESGSSFAAGIKRDGTAWGWGRNPWGNLGQPNPTQSEVPIEIENLEGMESLAFGGTHGLGLKSDGSLWAWGANNSGQLGDGTGMSTSSPIQITSLTGISAISAGGASSAAIDSSSNLYTWGSNSHGKLGTGTTADQSDVPVQVSSLDYIVSIEVSQWHMLAWRSTGTLYAWGDNWAGQLGDGTEDDSSIPVEVSGISNTLLIAAGEYHSIAADESGSNYGWGYNYRGQVGDGSNDYNITTPVSILNLTVLEQVAAGLRFSSALDTAGDVYTWGNNDYGQLGDGTLVWKNTPTHIAELSDIVMIAAGDEFMLALDSDGIAYSWGRNNFGQLGDGTTTNRTTPVVVGGLFTLW